MAWGNWSTSSESETKVAGPAELDRPRSNEAEAEEREDRYRSAYQAQPETDAEREWAEEAAEDLFDDDDTGWSGTDQAITGAAG